MILNKIPSVSNPKVKSALFDANTDNDNKPIWHEERMTYIKFPTKCSQHIRMSNSRKNMYCAGFTHPILLQAPEYYLLSFYFGNLEDFYIIIDAGRKGS